MNCESVAKGIEMASAGKSDNTITALLERVEEGVDYEHCPECAGNYDENYFAVKYDSHHGGLPQWMSRLRVEERAEMGRRVIARLPPSIFVDPRFSARECKKPLADFYDFSGNGDVFMISQKL